MHNIAFNTDSIFNSFLKIMSTSFIKIIIILTQAFWDVFYYLKWFQITHTVTLCKFEKSNYIIFKVWQLIALLSMIEKTIKIIMITYLKQMMKVYDMLLKQQMRECQDYFTKTALDLLINQIHEIWNVRNYIIFLLILDITEVYDRMICKHLVHMLRAKRISEKMIN